MFLKAPDLESKPLQLYEKNGFDDSGGRFAIPTPKLQKDHSLNASDRSDHFLDPGDFPKSSPPSDFPISGLILAS